MNDTTYTVGGFTRTGRTISGGEHSTLADAFEAVGGLLRLYHASTLASLNIWRYETSGDVREVWGWSANSTKQNEVRT